jgi:hypothetical protein
MATAKSGPCQKRRLPFAIGTLVTVAVIVGLGVAQFYVRCPTRPRSTTNLRSGRALNRRQSQPSRQKHRGEDDLHEGEPVDCDSPDGGIGEVPAKAQLGYPERVRRGPVVAETLQRIRRKYQPRRREIRLVVDQGEQVLTVNVAE